MIILGEPLRFLISKTQNFFNELDILQIIVLNFYLGGLIIYVISMVPIPLFNELILGGFLVGSIVLLFFLHYQKIKQVNYLSIHKLLFDNTSAILKGIVVFSMFLMMLLFQAEPVTNFVFGNVHDSSLYGLYAKLIIQNQNVPATLEPFSSEGVYYPQAFFVNEAFGHFITGFNLAEITLLITPLFQALTVLGAYYFGKKSQSQNLGVSFAFIFFVISRWPRLLAWGSNTFIAGFPLFFICMSLFVQLIKHIDIKNDFSRILFIGILFGYLGAVNLVFLQSLFMALLVSLPLLLKRSKNIAKSLATLILVLTLSLVVISPYLFRFTISISESGHNVGLPIDVATPETHQAWSYVKYELAEIYQGFFVLDWISPYRILKYETLLLISLSIVIIFFIKGISKLKRFRNVLMAISMTFIGSILVLSMRHLGMIFFSMSLSDIVTNWAETAIIIFVPLCLFIGVLTIILYNDLTKFVRSRFRSLLSRKKYTIIVSILLIFPVFTPYFYYSFLHDQQYLLGQYDIFCITSLNDHELMKWMENNIPDEAIVLVDPIDAGGFIPIISNKRIVYPFTVSRSSIKYSTLVSDLKLKNLNDDVYKKLEMLNISHIFIGENVIVDERISQFEGFEPMLFLGNPNFEFVKREGESYLFSFINNSRNIIFYDSFERSDLKELGWRCEFSTPTGSGLAEIVENQSTIHENRCLKMTARTHDNITATTWLFREIYLPTSGIIQEVILSFDLNHTSFFDEGFSIIISDLSWKKQITISTFEGGEYKLDENSGFFEVNLSELWTNKFNSKLPISFILQLENIDNDGIENIVYIDDLQLSFNPQ